jgi:hypothetical protein
MAVAPTFNRGGDAAQEADDALSASRGGNFRKTHYLPKIGKNNHIILRYITDDPQWYHMDTHPFVPTKPQSASWPKERTYPASMPAICRNDQAFRKAIPPIYTECYIDDAKIINKWGKECKPVIRVWAIACLREEVIGTEEMAVAGQIPVEKVGQRVGCRDQMREFDETDAEGKPTGKKLLEPALIVVNQPMSNYFGGLHSLYGLFHTVCDRDFVVLQKNEGKDVDFQHIHMDPTPNHKPGTESWKRYDEAVKAQGIDIEGMLMDRSSDEYFATFFDPSKEPTPKAQKDGGTSANPSAPAQQQAAAPTNDPDLEALAAMRDRVKSHISGDTTGPVTTPVGQVDFN